jgi:hypothetical protein
MISQSSGSKGGGEMSRKRFMPVQIIGKLREAEVALARGQTAAQMGRTLGIAGQKFHPSPHKYGCLNIWKGGS